MPEPVATFIALGANLGEPASQIASALTALAALPQSRLGARSSLYRSEPAGFTGQPDFINAVARLDTALAPRALLDALLAIEQAHGRTRAFRNAPRTLDLDILLYGDLVLDQPGLHLPHPRLHERAFVLLPLAEIAPATVIPGRGRIDALLARINAGAVRRLAPA